MPKQHAQNFEDQQRHCAELFATAKPDEKQNENSG